MAALSLFRRLLRQAINPIRRPVRRGRRSTAPLCVETLEDRTLLTLIYGPPAPIDLTNSGATANNGASTQANTLSADGQYAVFISSATDLNVANFSGTLPGNNEVYVRDLVNGTTNLVSLSPDGSAAGDGNSQEAVISANGEYVAFQSSADNLVNGVAGFQVYVCDLADNTIVCASAASGGGGNGTSEYPSLSSNGLVVAFDSYATNLVPGLANPNGTGNVYAYHLDTGVTEMASVAASGGTGGNGSSYSPQVSADGSTVVFDSYATNLAPSTTIGAYDANVYARRLSTSSVSPNTTYLVSAEVSGITTANNQSTTTGQSVSADGQYEVFSSYATDLIPGIYTDGSSNVYLLDRTTGAVTLLSAAISDPNHLTGGNGASYNAVISADGNYVAFVSGANNLLSVPGNLSLSNNQIYVWDRTTGTITLASPSDDSGVTGNLGCNNQSGFDPPSISDASQSTNGVVVAYDSDATDLDPNATINTSNNQENVYAFNVSTSKVQLVSLSEDGVHSGNNYSYAPVVSADGSTVVFSSDASNLVSNATINTNTIQIYARTLSATQCVLVSAEIMGAATANNTSSTTAQSVSADGVYEVFSSYATDLIAGLTTNGQENVYLRNRTTGAVTLVSAAVSDPTHQTSGSSNSYDAVISADGNYVAFVSGATNLVNLPANANVNYNQIFVWDRTTGKITLASPSDDSATTNNIGGNSNSGIDVPSISDASQSSNGVVVAYDSNASNLDPNANVTYGQENVYAFNVSTGRMQLVSLAANGGNGGNDTSDNPLISADGSTVTFESTASNLVPNATVGDSSTQQIYARQLSAANVVLVSSEFIGASTANNTSFTNGQSVSANGVYEVFTSSAGDLIAGLAIDGFENVYLRDRVTGVITLISAAVSDPTHLTGGYGNSFDAVISADGNYVAFLSDSNNLVNVPSGLVLNNQQVYVWDRTTGEITLASPSDDTATTGNLGGNVNSGPDVPSISDASQSTKGVVVAYDSAASDLDPNATVTSDQENVYAFNVSTGKVQLVSVSADGVHSPNDQSLSPLVSADGSTVVFESNATNIDPNASDTINVTNIYARKLSAAHAVMVSIGSDGVTGGNNNSYAPSISANGQYVAFDSMASNLTAYTTYSSFNVFVRDLSADSTTLISINQTGTAAGNVDSNNPSISANGSEIAFQSSSSDLTGGVASDIDNIYVRSWQGGNPTTTLETPDAAGTDGGNNNSINPVLSADGSTVAFVSQATNLISGVTTNGNWQVYVKPFAGSLALATAGSGAGGNNNADINTLIALSSNGAVAVFDDYSNNLVANDFNNFEDVYDFSNSTIGIVSAKPVGEFGGYNQGDDPTIDANGQYIAYKTQSVDIVPLMVGGSWQIYVRDLNADTTTLISVNLTGTGSAGESFRPSISANGSEIAFEASGTDLTSGVSGGHFNIYVRDWQAANPATTLETPNGAGTDGGNADSMNAVISADGSTVAFVSYATDLLNGVTTNGNAQVYVKPLNGPLRLATAGLSSTGGNASADTNTKVALSSNGAVAVFDNNSSNLVANDYNNTEDVFDFSNSTIGIASAKAVGVFSGYDNAYDPAISADGQYIAFDTNSDSLVPLITFGSSQVYIRDLNADTTTLISINQAGAAGSTGNSYVPSISANGSELAFYSTGTDLTNGVATGTSNIYVRNWQGGSATTTLLTPNAAGTDGGNGQSLNPVLSADGSTVAFVSYATDLLNGVTTNGNWQVYVKPLAGSLTLATAGSGAGGNNNADTSTPIALSGSGNVAVFDNYSSNLVANDYNNTENVYAFSNSTLGLVSAKPAGIFSGFESAQDPVVSANGQYVAFDSNSSDLAPYITFGATQVYVRDLNADTTALISVNQAGTAGSMASSSAPSISASGSEIAFESSGTDLTNGVMSGTSNIYVRNWQGGTPTTTLMTPNAAGTDGGNGQSVNPVLSADGSTVAFLSYANDLLDGVTTNGYFQVYIKPLTGALILASPGSGAGGNNNSDTPVLDADGDTLLFESYATNLAANDTNSTENVYAVQAYTISIGNVIGVASFSGSTTFTFNVTLSSPSTQTVTVQYATSDGTAHAPGDYQAQSGSVTFTPGVVSQSINIIVNEVSSAHPPETFFVTLTNPTNATVASGTGTGTILTSDTPPLLGNDSYTVHKNVPLTISAPGVLGNDTYTAGLTLTATLVGGPADGSLTFNSAGGFTYIPDQGFTGTDSFTYTANDGIDNSSNTATVTLSVINDAPVAVNDVYSIPAYQTLTVGAPGVLANDTDLNGDSLTAVQFSAPAHGTLTPDANGDGGFTYTPQSGYVGADTFSYYANDGTTNSAAPGVVTINVTLGTSTPTLTDYGPNPSNPGQSVTFVIDVTGGGSPTGTVTLEDGSNGYADRGRSSLANGSATIAAALTTGGTHDIIAYYSGDATHQNGYSNYVPQVVASNTTTTLTENGPNPALLGQGVTFTAAVSAGAAVNGETVTLEDVSNSSVSIGSGTLANGSATIEVANLPVGTHNIIAVYQGDSSFYGSQSGSVSQTVNGLISSFGSLPPVEPLPQFNVYWSGTAATGWSITSYTIYVSDNGAPYTTLLTNTTATSDVFSGQYGQTYSFYSVTNGKDNNGSPQSSPASPVTTTTVRAYTTTLTVTSFTPTATGFTVTFNEPFLNTSTKPIHLYSADASNAAYGPADVTVVGANAGAVAGSLIVNANDTGFTFIKTNVATDGATTGLLTPDTYTVTFLSSPTGFQDTNGNLLDGTGSGVPGANYVTTFTVTAPTANAVTVSIPDFARGPDNADSINIGNNTSNGIPVSLSNGSGVTSGSVTVTYNPSLLSITAVFANPTLGGASFALDPGSSAGIAILDFKSPTPLSAGAVTLGGLIAYTPSNAAYKSKELLQIASSLNGGAIPTINDNAVQVVAYLGNVSGSGFYSSLDSGEMLNVASGADAGFSQFPVIDPVILGSLIGGESQVSTTDALQLNLRIATGANPYVPNYPGTPSNNPSGPDPTLSIPPALPVSADGTVLVPVNIDDADPAGSTGMTVAQVALKYDPAEFSVTPQDVQLGSVPESGTGWTLRTVVDPSAGTIGITLSSETPINSSLGGSLAVIALHELPTATPGATAIDLVSSVMANGQVYSTSVNDQQGPFTLSAAPSNNGAASGLEGTVVLPGTGIISVAVSGRSAEQADALPAWTTFDNVALPMPPAAVIGATPIGVSEERVENAATPVNDTVNEPDTIPLASSMAMDHEALAFALPMQVSAGIEAAPVNGYVFTANVGLAPAAGGNPVVGVSMGPQAGNAALAGALGAGPQAAPHPTDQLFQDLALGEIGPALPGAAAAGDWLHDEGQPLDLLSQKDVDANAMNSAALDGYFAQFAADSPAGAD